MLKKKMIILYSILFISNSKFAKTFRQARQQKLQIILHVTWKVSIYTTDPQTCPSLVTYLLYILYG